MFVKRLYRKLRKRFQGPRISEAERLMARPFETKDLLPVPEGYEVGPPDFVGIALSKAGTSWWYRLLLDHPCVKPNRLAKKELCYFYHFGYRGLSSDAIDTYRQAFAAPSGCICGEWSTVYVTYPLAINHLAKAAPDVKLLAIVRNPVDRARSAVNQLLSARAKWMNLEGERADVLNLVHFALVMYENFLYEPFRRVLKLFDQSQLLLLQYEKCKQDPASEIARTYRFLDLDDSYIPDSLDRKLNVRPYIIPKLKPHERAALADYFADDVRAFVELFPEIDLSLWPDFKNR